MCVCVCVCMRCYTRTDMRQASRRISSSRSLIFRCSFFFFLGPRNNPCLSCFLFLLFGCVWAFLPRFSVSMRSIKKGRGFGSEPATSLVRARFFRTRTCVSVCLCLPVCLSVCLSVVCGVCVEGRHGNDFFFLDDARRSGGASRRVRGALWPLRPAAPQGTSV